MQLPLASAFPGVPAKVEVIGTGEVFFITLDTRK